MSVIWKAALEQFEKRADFVTAVILGSHGSSPRHTGTRFLVNHLGDIVGTIGGGLLESQVREKAMNCLAQRRSARASFAFTGADAHSPDMICGGSVDILIEYHSAEDTEDRKVIEGVAKTLSTRSSALLITELGKVDQGDFINAPKRLLVEPGGNRTGALSNAELILRSLPESRLLKSAQLLAIPGTENAVFVEVLRPSGTVYIMGAGHVGRALAHFVALCDFSVVVVDDRAEFADPERIPDADEVAAVTGFDGVFHDRIIDADSYIVIVTRGHSYDKFVLAQALKTEAGYIGMIGSRRKIALIYQSLLTEGFNRTDLERVHAPIGLAIGGETPEEIAVSITAQLISSRSKRTHLQKL